MAEPQIDIEWLRERADERREIWKMDEIKNRLLGSRDALIEQRSRLVETVTHLRSQISDIDRKLGDCLAAGRVFGIEMEALPIVTIPRIANVATIKNIVQQRLDANKAFRVIEHKEAIVLEYGRPIHVKSIGVALQRLRSEGLARNVKHDWYATA